MKIILNKGNGKFKFSEEAIRLIRKQKLIKYNSSDKKTEITFFHPDDWRYNPEAILIVEELGPKASARFAKLVVVTIPDNMKYYISEVNNTEFVHEVHRVW